VLSLLLMAAAALTRSPSLCSACFPPLAFLSSCALSAGLQALGLLLCRLVCIGSNRECKRLLLLLLLLLTCLQTGPDACCVA
jgi:hypothetical protein